MLRAGGFSEDQQVVEDPNTQEGLALLFCKRLAESIEDGYVCLYQLRLIVVFVTFATGEMKLDFIKMHPKRSESVLILAQPRAVLF